jgi:hypothetical protein
MLCISCDRACQPCCFRSPGLPCTTCRRKRHRPSRSASMQLGRPFAAALHAAPVTTCARMQRCAAGRQSSPWRMRARRPRCACLAPCATCSQRPACGPTRSASSSSTARSSTRRRRSLRAPPRPLCAAHSGRGSATPKRATRALCVLRCCDLPRCTALRNLLPQSARPLLETCCGVGVLIFSALR